MASQRKVIDCRMHPSSDKNCSLSIAGTDEEVLETAIYHATTKHGHNSSPEVDER
jgi:hypothetical protein